MTPPVHPVGYFLGYPPKVGAAAKRRRGLRAENATSPLQAPRIRGSNDSTPRSRIALPARPPLSRHGTVVADGMQSSFSFTVPSTPSPNWFAVLMPVTF